MTFELPERDHTRPDEPVHAAVTVDGILDVDETPPVPATSVAGLTNYRPDALSLHGRVADLERRLDLIHDMVARMPPTWERIHDVIVTIRAVSAR